MTIAELFVKIGIRGGDDAKKQLVGVHEGLGEIKNQGLAAKAMLLAVMYGMKQMMSSSMEAGMSLEKFAIFTGLSTKKLQEYQYAGRQFGATNDQMTGSIKNLQAQMADMKLSKAPSEYFNTLAHHTQLDRNKAYDDPFYMMEKLQEFAQKTEIDKDIRNRILSSFGLPEEIQNAMSKGGFNSKAFSKAPVTSDGTIKSLANVNKAWTNLEEKMGRGLRNLVSRHGEEMVKNIDKLVTQILKLSDALLLLAEKLKVFEAVGVVLKGWSQLIGLINQTAEGKSDIPSPSDVVGMMGQAFRDMFPDDLAQELLEEGDISFKTGFRKMFGGGEAVTPTQKRGPSSIGGNTQQTSNTTFNIGDRADIKEIISKTQDVINKTFRQGYMEGQKH